jgi:hypothetical protein
MTVITGFPAVTSWAPGWCLPAPAYGPLPRWPLPMAELAPARARAALPVPIRGSPDDAIIAIGGAIRSRRKLPWLTARPGLASFDPDQHPRTGIHSRTIVKKRSYIGVVAKQSI